MRVTVCSAAVARRGYNTPCNGSLASFVGSAARTPLGAVALQRAAVQSVERLVCMQLRRRNASQECGRVWGWSRARGGFTSLTRSSKLPGLQWSADARPRALLAVSREVPDEGRSRGALNLGLNCLSSRLTGVNRARFTGALRRLIPIPPSAATGPVENDAARAAPAQKPSSALLNLKGCAYHVRNRAAAVFHLRRQPTARPRSARAATAPGATEGTRRGPRAGPTHAHAAAAHPLTQKIHRQR